MIHIYTGDGKGKTTCAVGLAVRAAGAGKKVCFFQFLKDDTSGEISALSQINNIDVVSVGRQIPFLFDASEDEKTELKDFYKSKLTQILSAAEKYDVFIFDEAVCAVSEGITDKDDILKFDKFGELILTGRGDISCMEACADYVTDMKKIKHPYDSGIPAREGIEY